MTVEVRLTLNRLIKLKNQIIKELGGLGGRYATVDHSVSVPINKWSKSGNELATKLDAKRQANQAKLQEHIKLICALQEVKSLIYVANMHNDISSILLKLETAKSILNVYSSIKDELSSYENAEPFISVENATSIINAVRADIDKVEGGSEISEHIRFALEDIKDIDLRINDTKKMINDLEDLKLALNAKVVELTIDEEIAKKFFLV
jgi:hypothetical protein